MIGRILLLCFLVTTLRGVLLPDRPVYPYHRQRRQVGHTRDDHAPPHYRNILQNTRQHHRPILRDEIPVLKHKKPVLSISQELLMNTTGVPRFNKSYVEQTRPRNRNHYQWVRKEDMKKQSKRDSSNSQKTHKGNHERNRDAEAGYDTGDDNLGIDIINDEAAENNELLEPKNETAFSDHFSDLNSLQDEQVQINEPEDQALDTTPQGQAYDNPTPQDQSQEYPLLESDNLEPNAPLDVPHNVNDPRGQDQGYNGYQKQEQWPITPRSSGQNQDYNPHQGGGQGYTTPQGQDQGYNELQGQAYDNPTPQDQSQEYPLLENDNLEPNAPRDVPHNFNDPRGQVQDFNGSQNHLQWSITPRSLSQNQDYNHHQGGGQGYNAPQGQVHGSNGFQKQTQRPITPRSLSQNQDYNPLQGGQGYEPQALSQNLDSNALQEEGLEYKPSSYPSSQIPSQGHAYQDVEQGTNPWSARPGLGSAPQGSGYPSPLSDVGQEYKANQGEGQDNNPLQSSERPSGGLGNAPGMGYLPDFGQQYSIYPNQCNQVVNQGQISSCQNQIQDQCSLTGQCYPNDSIEVRKKMLQLIRDTKISIDNKVMPITQVHMAYKINRLYKIGYLVSSINRTQDSVADFYKYVEQNINSWDFMKVLQAYEQVKLADAFLTDVLYTLKQLASSVTVIDMLRAGKTSVNERSSDHMANDSEEYDLPKQLENGWDWDWLYYDD